MTSITQRERGHRGLTALFALCWLFVAFVSVHDGYLVALYPGTIVEFERNPINQRLLSFGGGNIWYMIAAKTVGTVLTCSLLLMLFWQKRWLGTCVAMCVAAFQLVLLLYLMFA